MSWSTSCSSEPKWTTGSFHLKYKRKISACRNLTYKSDPQAYVEPFIVLSASFEKYCSEKTLVRIESFFNVQQMGKRQIAPKFYICAGQEKQNWFRIHTFNMAKCSKLWFQYFLVYLLEKLSSMTQKDAKKGNVEAINNDLDHVLKTFNKMHIETFLFPNLLIVLARLFAFVFLHTIS